MLILYVLDVQEEAPYEDSLLGGATPDGKIPFPLMTKGGRFIRCRRQRHGSRGSRFIRCRGQRHGPRGSRIIRCKGQRHGSRERDLSDVEDKGMVPRGA